MNCKVVSSNSCPLHHTCKYEICLLSDYIGPDCSVRADTSPTISGIENSGTCDLQQRPCRQIFIAVEDIVDSSELSCKIVPFKVRLSLIFVITSE